MRVWGFGETIRSQGASYRDMRWERENHQASLCTEFASWCADYLLGPITLILINEHTTYNLSEKCEKKKWHMFGGCKRASPQIWKHLPQTAGLGVVMETTLEQGYDTEIWFKSLLWNACVKNSPWGWPRQGGVLRGKAGRGESWEGRMAHQLTDMPLFFTFYMFSLMSGTAGGCGAEADDTDLLCSEFA